ncbi:MAG: histidine phosphatase family protein [Alphaproteobacteria bacterium]|nr:histidine phosphatase family protein [Alphaproteobacteria bacterium]
MRPGTTLYFIRHGETGWNKARRIQGQIDSDLNETGRAQAARNGTVLRELVRELDALDYVASPLKRTSETMQIVRQNAGLARDGYRTDDRLKEIHFGTWQGAYWPEIPTVDRQGHTLRLTDPYNWRPESGESYADLLARCGAWFDELERDTVCVSHGGVSRVLRGHVCDVDRAEMTELPVPQDKILVFRHVGRGIEFEWV